MTSGIFHSILPPTEEGLGPKCLVKQQLFDNFKSLLSLIFNLLHGIPLESTTILLYYAIENTMVNKINATYVHRMMGRLDVLPSQIYMAFLYSDWLNLPYIHVKPVPY